MIKYIWLPLRFSEFLELVHLSTFFATFFGGYKKERKHEIERQALVHMSTLSNIKMHEVAI